MSKIAENKALEAYPEVKYKTLGMLEGGGLIEVDLNIQNRDGYIKGYDQAMQDFLNKACEWLSKQPMSRPVFWTVEDFKNYMEEEL